LSLSRVYRALGLPALVGANLALRKRQRDFAKAQFIESISLLQAAVATTLCSGLNSSNMLAREANWPQFRGPGARGITTNTNLPDRWSASENVAWKAEIPGRGWSSPIAWGECVFLTTAVNSGASEPPKKGLYIGGERPNAPRPEHEWKVICLDLPSGKVQWEHAVHRGPPPGPTHVKNSYASETPVTDGQHVYVCVGNVGVFCLRSCGPRGLVQAAGTRTRSATAGARPLRRCCTGTGYT
jgi:hypothetical protein